MLSLQFHGAAQTVTGSCIEAGWAGRRILLDCGLVQGVRNEAAAGLKRPFPFDPAGVDAVVLSHAHLDHSGNIPALVRQGFRGPIYTTLPTRDLCYTMFHDTAHLQTDDVRLVKFMHFFESLPRLQQSCDDAYLERAIQSFTAAGFAEAAALETGDDKLARFLRFLEALPPLDPPYDEGDVDRAMELFRAVEYAETVPLAPGLDVTLNDAGHILGSASICLDYTREGEPRRLLFTGDLGQGKMPLLRDPVPVADVNVLVTESTYGNHRHSRKGTIVGRLAEHLRHAKRNKSKIIIPAFSVGRTQQLLYYFNKAFAKHEKLKVPVIVDSPMARSATQAYEIHRNFLKKHMQRQMLAGRTPFVFPKLRYIFDHRESAYFRMRKGPMVVISASGMCQGGRILKHLACAVTNPLNIVLMVEYQAGGTLGRSIAKRETPVQIRGINYPLNAKVHFIEAMSGHADAPRLRAFYERLGGKMDTAFCVHGEPPQCKANAKMLTGLGVPNVHVPVLGQRFENV